MRSSKTEWTRRASEKKSFTELVVLSLMPHGNRVANEMGGRRDGRDVEERTSIQPRSEQRDL